ncbi:MAG TPA: MFS transporter [Pilimelia sp.]|nr:MFS transporter [Pilimelia sp.]
MSSPLGVLARNRDFRRLFLAELVVFGADWLVLVPLLVLLPELTGSGLYGGLVLAADPGIIALLLPYAGTVADRVDRKRIMMLANVGAVLGMLVLLGVRTPATAWLAVVGIGCVAVAKAFYSPAASAALPNLVAPEDLAPANAIAGSVWGTMTIVGASVGGVLSAVFSPYTCFWIAAVGLAVAAAVTWRIRRPMQAAREISAVAPRAWAAIRESLGYIGRHRRVLALVTVKSAVGLGNGVLTVFPLLAVSFGVGGPGAGMLFAVRGAGALVGPLLMRRVLTHRSWLLPGLAISMSVYGLAYLGVAATPWFALVLALVFIAHLAGGTNWVISNYALQNEVPDHLRGRVFATDLMLATLAISVSQLVVGALVDSVDAHVLIACCGATTLLYALGWRLATRRLALSERAGAG